MKKRLHPLALIVILALISSCTTIIQMQKTYPPEAELPDVENRYVFVNFFDYQIPDFIKDKHEIAYAAAVKGYADGLAAIILQDRQASLTIADTLRKGFTVMSMQYPEFADTVRAICKEYSAGLLVALDSINLWIDSEFYITKSDEGSSMMAKDFYVYANSYITLYTSDGEVVDRCAGELSDYVKSKYTIFGMIGGPTLARERDRVRALAETSAKECIGKFYPYTDHYVEKLYGGGPFNKLNSMIMEGHPEETIEPLRQLAGSSDPNTARKASWNLRVVNDILENRRSTDEVWENFTKVKL